MLSQKKRVFNSNQMTEETYISLSCFKWFFYNLLSTHCLNDVSYNLQITNSQRNIMKVVIAAVIFGMVMLINPSAGNSPSTPKGLF